MKPEVLQRQAAALCLLVVAGSVAAETLPHAWALALAADRGLLAARETAAAADSQWQAARAAAGPQVALQAGYSATGAAPTMRADLVGTTVELPVAQTGSAAYKASVTLPLYAGGRIERGIAAAAAARAAASSGVEGRRQDLKLQVAEAFVAVLRATRGRELAATHVDRLVSHVQGVRHRLAQGMVARSDLLTAEVALAEARQGALQADHAAQLALAQYNRWLGRAFEHSAALETPAPEPLVAAPLPELSARALSQRSELGQFTSQIDALRHQAAAVRAEAAPQVALSGGYAYQQNRYQVHPGQWFAGVGVAWSLFDGGAVGHRADAVERQAAALAAQRDELASLLVLQVRQSWLGAQEAQQRGQLGAAAVAQAEENLRVVQDRYAQGLTTHTEVLQAEVLRRSSQVLAADAVFDACLAGLRLRRAMGEL